MLWLITNETNNYQINLSDSEFTIFWKRKKVPFQIKYGNIVSLTLEVPSREVLIVIPHSEMPDLAYCAAVNGLDDVDTVLNATALQKFIQEQKNEWTNLAGNVSSLFSGVDVLKSEISRVIEQGKLEINTELKTALANSSSEIKELVKNANTQQNSLSQKITECRASLGVIETSLATGTRTIHSEVEKIVKTKELTDGLIATFSGKIEQLTTVSASIERLILDSETALRNLKAGQKAIEEIWNKCNKLTISVEK